MKNLKIKNRFSRGASMVLTKARVSTLLPKGAEITFVKNSAILMVPDKKFAKVKDVKLSHKEMIEHLDDWYCI